MKYIVFILLSSVFGIGCRTVQPIGAEIPPIIIKKPETRTSGLSKITFPAGTYIPDFQINEGVYYLAPTKLIGGFRLATEGRPVRGGLFIPKPGAPNQQQACWIDQDNAITRRLWRFNTPISYEIQK